MCVRVYVYVCVAIVPCMNNTILVTLVTLIFGECTKEAGK